MPLELHCHTLFSVDGRGTPEDLVDTAADRGISTLALTDHNSLGGQARAKAQADRRGIRFLPGVEFDAVWNGRSHHFVALGIDPDHGPLRALAERNFSIYEHTFGLYLERLEARFPGLEQKLRQELPTRYPSHPAPVLNQWFARDILTREGTVEGRDAFSRLVSEVRKQVVAKQGAEVFRLFADLDEVLGTVHDAGGLLVAAHVAQYFKGDAEAQLAFIRSAVEKGVDGFELYHPLNLAEPHFGRLVAEAQALGCVATGGSDCHDAGQNDKNPIASVHVPDGLLDRIDAALAERRA